MTQAVPVGHETHGLPLMPQVLLVTGAQLDPWQQVAQVVTEQVSGTQVRLMHRSVAGQVRHSAPALPQLKSSVPS